MPGRRKYEREFDLGFRLGRPPGGSAHSVAAVEDAACRAVLRAAGATPAQALARRGVAVQHVTFSMVRDLLELNVFLAATADPLDAPAVLFGRFVKSKAWAAWVSAWDDQPDAPPGGRVLVARSQLLNHVAVYDLAPGRTPPARPHFVVGHAAGVALVIEPVLAWVKDHVRPVE